MKILVTGGAGFIASHVVDAYISKGHTVFVIDNLSSGKKEFVNNNAVLYEVDVRDKKRVEEVIEKERPDVINHHAAQISVRDSVENPQNDAETNILGLLNVLEAGRKCRVKKVIFISSGGVVYGDANTIPTPETYHPLLPLSPYGVSKFASELYLHFYYKTYGIPYTALRYSNVYGPRQNPHGEAGVVAIFSKKMLSGQKPTINGDGLQTRDYIYVGDVVEANMKALQKNVVGAINIGTGRETNVIEIYEGIRKAVGSEIQPQYGPAKKGEQKRSCLNIQQAKKVLGWKPHVTLSEGLEKTVAYFKHESS